MPSNCILSPSSLKPRHQTSVTAVAPTKRMHRVVNRALEALYSLTRRPTPPELLLRTQLPQILYSIRTEHIFLKRLSYNLTFR
jgi:transposase